MLFLYYEFYIEILFYVVVVEERGSVFCWFVEGFRVNFWILFFIWCWFDIKVRWFILEKWFLCFVWSIMFYVVEVFVVGNIGFYFDWWCFF